MTLALMSRASDFVVPSRHFSDAGDGARKKYREGPARLKPRLGGCEASSMTLALMSRASDFVVPSRHFSDAGDGARKRYRDGPARLKPRLGGAKRRTRRWTVPSPAGLRRAEPPALSAAKGHFSDGGTLSYLPPCPPFSSASRTSPKVVIRR